MSKGNLLVLGASLYQVEVIRKAKELGYRVITTDNIPANPGHALADESFDVDTTDMPRVLEIAKACGVCGVVSPATDVAVATAAFVSESMGLRPRIPLESARILTSKIRFRQFLSNEGLPVPRFRMVSREDDGAAFWLDEVEDSRRRILKPEGSSGSKGIFIVSSPAELVQRLSTALSFSPIQSGILEEMIEGRQGTCEGVVLDGQLVFALVTDRLTTPAPHVATAGHLVPSNIATEAREQMLEQIRQVLTKSNIESSIFDCDFVIDDKGIPYLLELTPRLGGNSLTRLAREATGIDLAEIAVRLACGDQAAIELPSIIDPKPTAQLILGPSKAGRLRFDEKEAAALRSAPWLRDLTIDYPMGHSVEAFINGRTRVGEASLVAPSREALDARVSELQSRLRLETVAAA